MKTNFKTKNSILTGLAMAMAITLAFAQSGPAPDPTDPGGETSPPLTTDPGSGTDILDPPDGRNQQGEGETYNHSYETAAEEFASEVLGGYQEVRYFTNFAELFQYQGEVVMIFGAVPASSFGLVGGYFPPAEEDVVFGIPENMYPWPYEGDPEDCGDGVTDPAVGYSFLRPYYLLRKGKLAGVNEAGQPYYQDCLDYGVMTYQYFEPVIGTSDPGSCWINAYRAEACFQYGLH